MGYTNHWNRPTEFDKLAFARAVRDCTVMLPKLGVSLAGFDGTDQPIFEPDHIVFNGASPQCCEPFEIARVQFDRRGRERFSCSCKTEHLPYDLCVKSAMLIFSHHLGDLMAIGSDGPPEDWTEAHRRVKEVLGFDGGMTQQGLT